LNNSCHSLCDGTCQPSGQTPWCGSFIIGFSPENEKIFALSQELVPVDKGTLQRSGVHKHEYLKSEVSYNTPYAGFVHDGTSKMEARPFLGQAVSAVLPELKKELKDIAKP